MRSDSDRHSKRKSTQKLYVQSSFFFFENRAICEIMWRNVVEPDRPQMKI